MNTPERRGAGINTPNRFIPVQRDYDPMWADEATDLQAASTVYLEEKAKQLVNEVKSPDVGMRWSANPYQGCEHGCVYCYARNTHEYWGFSAGIDFEQRIMVKQNAPELLHQFLRKPGWDATPISLSGNTDCYQPAERRFGLTRQLLNICLDYRQPVGIITKNALILRDVDLLKALAARRLVHVMITITTWDEDLRRAMEPRTATAARRMQVIEQLNDAGIPCGIMMGPVIPGLNDAEMHGLLHRAAMAGARHAAYTFVRLNGSVRLIFHNWLYRHFPDRADKVWHLIEQGHGGTVSDSRFGKRMRGEGVFADLLASQFKAYCKKMGFNEQRISLASDQFCVPGSQGRLF